MTDLGCGMVKYQTSNPSSGIVKLFDKPSSNIEDVLLERPLSQPLLQPSQKFSKLPLLSRTLSRNRDLCFSHG